MWRSVIINNVQYFTSLEIKPTKQLSITLSDLTYLWRETLSIGETVLRFKKCNPKASLSEDRIIEFVEELFLTDDCIPNLEMEVSGDKLKLNISKTLIVKMSYYFTLEKLTEESVYRELIIPLLLVINELKFAQEELYKKLAAKDLHLKEFELERYHITRKNVVTSVFRKEEFKKELKENFEDRIKFGLENASSIFIEGVNEVYPAFQKLVQPLCSAACGSATEERKESRIEEVSDKPTISSNKRNQKEKEETVVCKRLKSTKKIIM
ncbi:uncharacterized protein [Halyomorpha halys]|uniref:uncharacterized protein n=1 Tax=Halyomorpha halys TaxID=286706 RepID=UPI0006D4D338|nr:uncharacterized protein LOC106677071 [Halyomorpha halys]